jgi:hypothetical protein
MIPVYETNVVALAQANLVHQYRELPALESLMTADAYRIEINQTRESQDYTVTVDGVDYTYRSKPGETAEQIAYGLYLILLGFGVGGEGFGFGEVGGEPFGGGL